MSLKRLILAIDWSNMFYRSLFLNGLYHNSSKYETERECKSFGYQLCQDVCSIINLIQPASVYILIDAYNPWRNDLLTNETIGYKGARHKDENINWSNVREVSDDILTLFENAGAILLKNDRTEADDIAALLSESIKELNSDNLIIVSSDADLRQLASFNETTKQYVAIYNPISSGKVKDKKLYVANGVNGWLSSTSQSANIFAISTMDNGKKQLNDFIKRRNIIVNEINPNDIVIDKVLCGDDGDSVPAFYNWVNPKGKFDRITPAKAKKIKESLNITKITDFNDNLQSLNEILGTIAKKSINDIDVAERLKRQRQLVELNSQLFPTNITDYKTTIINHLTNSAPIKLTNFFAKTMLEHSSYKSFNPESAVLADIFKNYNNTTTSIMDLLK